MYTVYKIINNINGKIYIGVHKTKNPNDGYMGSGKLIRKAIDKHGLENFTKRILYITEHRNLAYRLEENLVTEDFIKRKDNYNLKIGGIGGRHKSSYTDKERIEKSIYLKNNNPAYNMSEETKIKMSKSKTGKPSNAKGNFKVEGDGKWEGTAHKGKDNPRAKHIQIFNNDGELIYDCLGTFHAILKENNLPQLLRKSLKNNGEPLKIDLKRIKKKYREHYRKFIGWYAKEVK